MIQQTFTGPNFLRGGGDSDSVAPVLTVKYADHTKFGGGYRPIIFTPKVFLDYRYVAVFRNEGNSKAKGTGVENWG